MPNFRKFVGVVKAGQLSQTYIHTDRGYLIGPFPSGGPKKSFNRLIDWSENQQKFETNFI